MKTSSLSSARSSIHIQKVFHQFPFETKPLFAVADFEFRPEESYLLLGPSGCGKSTFLDFIHGDSPLTQGQLAWKTPENDHAPLRQIRRSLSSRIYQDLNLIEEFSVLENARLELTEEELPEFTSLLTQLNFRVPVQRKVSQLSFGEKQRLAVARACAKKTSWLLADEPTSHLDPSNSKMVVGVMKKSGKSLIVVSHDHSLSKEFSQVIEFNRWIVQ